MNHIEALNYLYTSKNGIVKDSDGDRYQMYGEVLHIWDFNTWERCQHSLNDFEGITFEIVKQELKSLKDLEDITQAIFNDQDVYKDEGQWRFCNTEEMIDADYTHEEMFKLKNWKI